MAAEIVEQERKGRFGNGGFHPKNPRGFPVTNWDNVETTKYPRSIVDKALDVFLANRSKAKELWGAVSTLQQMRDSVGKVAWPDNMVVDVTATPIGEAATGFQSLVAQFMDKLRTEAEYKGLDGRNDLGIGVRYIPNHSQPRTARSAKAYCGLNELQQDSIERSRCFKVGKLWTSDRQANFEALIAEYQLFMNAAILSGVNPS